MIALLNLSALGFSFVFHDKTKRTQQENLLMTDKTLSLYDSWQVLHTVFNVVRFMKGKSFLSDPAIKVLNATSPPFPSLSRNIILEPELL